MRPSRIRLRSFLVAAVAILGGVLPGCQPLEPPPDPPAVRLIEPPPASVATTSLPRVELGSESRYVLAASSPVILRSGAAVTLPESGELRIAIDPRGAGAKGARVRLEGWISVLEESDRKEPFAELLGSDLMILRAEPVIIENQRGNADESAGGRQETLTFAVPERARGQTGSLDVVARPLPAEPIQAVEAKEVVVPAASRIEFGYGVEQAAWDEGWPPVRFELAAVPRAPRSTPRVLFERRIDPAKDPRDRRWFDASVDLSEIAGSHVRFVFTAEAIRAAPGTKVDRSFAVFSTPEIVAFPAAGGRSHAPNIVLISLDTLRARSVTAYGYARQTTPTIDRRLAARGALVRFAVTPAPYTPPAHMSMLTGLEPCVHDVDGRLALSAAHVTIAEILRAEGYRTAAFTEDGLLMRGAGFERGFDTYVENRSAAADVGSGRETFAAAGSWIEGRSRSPFFLFIHTYQVHGPYAAPRGYDTLFTDAAEKAERGVARARYDREVRYTDDLLADFLDTLARHGVEENTIVVVTSDHGEGFGEHFWVGHGFDLHDEALLVPLVIRAPGQVPAGTVVEKQVGLVDVMPTLLALAGVPPPGGIQGRSFAGELTGRGEAFEERPLLSYLGDGSAYAIRTPRDKYIQHSRDGKIIGERYYDLLADPLERNNLARTKDTVAGEAGGARRAAIRRARRGIEAARAACETWRREHLAAQGAEDRAISPLTPGSAPRGVAVRDEVLRKLKALGYVQ